MSQSEQKIVQYLNEAHALEVGLAQVLRSQIAMTPEGSYRSGLEKHLRETQTHADRVKARQGALSTAGDPFAAGVAFMEDIAAQTLALWKAPLDLMRGATVEEKVLENAKEACAAEALEIATYTALEHVARAAGDEETAELAASIRTDEERMLERVTRELPKLARAVAGDTADAVAATADATERVIRGGDRKRSRPASRTRPAPAAKRRTKPGTDRRGPRDPRVRRPDRGGHRRAARRAVAERAGRRRRLRADARRSLDDPQQDRDAAGRRALEGLRRAHRRGDPRARSARTTARRRRAHLRARAQEPRRRHQRRRAGGLERVGVAPGRHGGARARRHPLRMMPADRPSALLDPERDEVNDDGLHRPAGDRRATADLPLLAEAKLAPLRPPAGIIERPRIMQALDAGDGAALTLVAAPAGYGKTTAVRAWAAARGVALAWVTLDAGDNDPIRMWTYVTAAVGRVRSDLVARSVRQLQLPHGPIESSVDQLMNGIEVYGRELVLVLDDLQTVTDADALASIEYALRRVPPNGRVIAITRTDPALGLPQLRARGALAELRAGELAFTQAEAADVLHRQGIELQAEELQLLHARTEGWPAAILLAALWLRTVEDPRARGAEVRRGSSLPRRLPEP